MSVVNSTWHDEALVPSEELVAPLSDAKDPPASDVMVEAIQPPQKTFIRRAAAGLMSAWEWCFGVVSMIVILAFLATMPILNLMSLGYLLEVSGRIARTGKFTQGFVGIRKAARIGSIVAGAWLMFLPLRLLSNA